MRADPDLPHSQAARSGDNESSPARNATSVDRSELIEADLKCARLRVVLSPTELRSLFGEDQLTVIEAWFRERFEFPAVRTNYDSEDGIQILGRGPFEALRSEFEGLVSDDVIDELVDKLNGDSSEWAPVSSGEYFIGDAVWDGATDADLLVRERGLSIGDLPGRHSFQ